MRTKSKRVPQPGPMPTGPIAKITGFHETVHGVMPDPVLAPEPMVLPPAPSESDPIERLREIAAEAGEVIKRSNSGYVTAGYFSLGKCMEYARNHFAGNEPAYIAWGKKPCVAEMGLHQGSDYCTHVFKLRKKPHRSTLCPFPKSLPLARFKRVE